MNELIWKHLTISCLYENKKMRGRQSALLCCYWRHVSNSGEQHLCCTVTWGKSQHGKPSLSKMLSGHRVVEVKQIEHWVIFFTSSWFKLINAAECVGQLVSFVTAGVLCSALLPLVSEWRHRKLTLFVFQVNYLVIKSKNACNHCLFWRWMAR